MVCYTGDPDVQNGRKFLNAGYQIAAGVPLQIVGTKADKLKANEKHRNLAQLNKLFPTGHPALAYSSLKNEGFGPLAKNLFSRLQAFTNQP